MSEQTELKPCPFCGGVAAAYSTIAYNGDSLWFIGCDSGNCSVTPECQDGFDTDAEAIAAWNTRADTLTQEQRDVLTVWRWMKAVTGPGDKLAFVKTGALGIEEAKVRHTDIGMFAQRVREQEAQR